MAKKKIENNELTEQFPSATFEGVDVEKVAKDEKFMEAMKNDAEINEKQIELDWESLRNSGLDKPFEGTPLGGELTVNGNKLQQSIPIYQAPILGTHTVSNDLEGIELHAYEMILLKYEMLLGELTEIYKQYPTPRVQLQSVLMKDLIKTMKESIRYDIV